MYIVGCGVYRREVGALYSASLSFMFIFLLTLSDTKDCYYFKSNLSIMLLIKAFLTKKASIALVKSFKHVKITFPHVFILVFIPYFIWVMSSILQHTIMKSISLVAEMDQTDFKLGDLKVQPCQFSTIAVSEGVSVRQSKL